MNKIFRNAMVQSDLPLSFGNDMRMINRKTLINQTTIFLSAFTYIDNKSNLKVPTTLEHKIANALEWLQKYKK